jgi:hypothetical protein
MYNLKQGRQQNNAQGKYMMFNKIVCTKSCWNLLIKPATTGISHQYFDSNIKKSLKIPKGQSEAVNQRRSDNTIAPSPQDNDDLQNITQKTKDRAAWMNPTENRGGLGCFGSVSSSCSTCDIVVFLSLETNNASHVHFCSKSITVSVIWDKKKSFRGCWHTT